MIVMIWALLVMDLAVIFAIVRSVIFKSKVREIWRTCEPIGIRAHIRTVRACVGEVWRYLKFDAPGEQLILIAIVIPVNGEAIWLLLFGLGISLSFWILVACAITARSFHFHSAA